MVVSEFDWTCENSFFTEQLQVDFQYSYPFELYNKYNITLQSISYNILKSSEPSLYPRDWTESWQHTNSYKAVLLCVLKCLGNAYKINTLHSTKFLLHTLY